MPGWTVHSYLTLPGVSSFAVNVWPLPNSSDLKFAPELATALWSTESSLTQQTVSPAFALAALGSNLMSFMWIVSAALEQSPVEAGWPPESEPQAARPRARALATSRARMRRAFKQTARRLPAL